MGWRAATEADVARVLPFLDAHIQSSMFLLENLSLHGLGSDHPNGLTLWVQARGDGVSVSYTHLTLPTNREV